jgi:hypothetical protein
MREVWQGLCRSNIQTKDAAGRETLVDAFCNNHRAVSLSPLKPPPLWLMGRSNLSP